MALYTGKIDDNYNSKTFNFSSFLLKIDDDIYEDIEKAQYMNIFELRHVISNNVDKCRLRQACAASC